MLGLRFLRLDGGLPPEFCGFGSLKVNSRVPPTVRVCGVTVNVRRLASLLEIVQVVHHPVHAVDVGQRCRAGAVVVARVAVRGVVDVHPDVVFSCAVGREVADGYAVVTVGVPFGAVPVGVVEPGLDDLDVAAPVGVDAAPNLTWRR